MPRHGEERNRRTEHELATFRGQLPDGSKIRLTYAGHSATASEKWCEGCGAWIRVRGIMGALRFAFDHDHARQA